jgi:hypothetical protein
MKRRLILIAVAMTVIVSTTLPALAVRPEMNSFEFVDGPRLTHIPICEFPVEVLTLVEVTERFFFDQEGNPEKLIANVGEDQTLTNPDNGKSISGHSAYTVIVNFENGEPVTEQDVGVLAHQTVPGQGTVFLQAGRVVFDLETFEVVAVDGRSDLIDGDREAQCAALS